LRRLTLFFFAGFFTGAAGAPESSCFTSFFGACAR